MSSQPEHNCTSELPCNGETCYLVKTLLNQADTNLKPVDKGTDSRGIMNKEKFFQFLGRIAKEIPLCLQPLLANQTLQDVDQRAEEFFKSQSSQE